MFSERLQEMRERLGEAHAIGIVAGDGILVESIGGDGVDLEVLAAELVTQARAMAADRLELGGEVRQFSVTTERYTLLIGTLTAGYYMLVVLGDGASHGRARYELKRARVVFEGDLV